MRPRSDLHLYAAFSELDAILPGARGYPQRQPALGVGVGVGLALRLRESKLAPGDWDAPER